MKKTTIQNLLAALIMIAACFSIGCPQTETGDNGGDNAIKAIKAEAERSLEELSRFIESNPDAISKARKMAEDIISTASEHEWGVEIQRNARQIWNDMASSFAEKAKSSGAQVLSEISKALEKGRDLSADEIRKNLETIKGFFGNFDSSLINEISETREISQKIREGEAQLQTLQNERTALERAEKLYQSSTDLKEAERVMMEFVRNYPDSPSLPDMQKKLTELRNRIKEKEESAIFEDVPSETVFSEDDGADKWFVVSGEGWEVKDGTYTITTGTAGAAAFLDATHAVDCLVEFEFRLTSGTVWIMSRGTMERSAIEMNHISLNASEVSDGWHKGTLRVRGANIALDFWEIKSGTGQDGKIRKEAVASRQESGMFGFWVRENAEFAVRNISIKRLN